MDFKECLNFTKEKHKGQKRKQGTPYYTHPVSVSIILKKKGFSEEYQVAGLFHDLLEDTDATENEILNLSNENVLTAVRLVTKNKGYNMKDYINGIKSNNMAKMVKLADKLHNLMDIDLTDINFKKKALKESKEWYIDLAKDTVFENDINQAVSRLETQIKNMEDMSR